ncbi:carboxylesterase [Roseivivax marinus]|uniref:alpha/beta hydrolase n=1 Tax=Roseivivax marinus TaxID=1379903 RepID=UPI0008D33543|nr:alpha/beta fold hydrolase [Roseivivax marinus]SEL59998.1 carboxylesterase [Roseivivax marinus]
MDQTSQPAFDAPEAQPFLFEGGPTGVLMLHGFTSTPQSVRRVAQSVHDLTGATVMGPLLAGHGTSADDLARTTHQDWVDSAEAAMRALQMRCQRIFIGGLSLGATIALNIAARQRDSIDGVFSINGSTGLYRPEVVAPLYDPAAPEFVSGIGSDIAKEGERELCYDRIPHVTLQQRFLLTNATGALLPLIRQRLLIMQSRTDHVVAPENATHIATRVSSDDIRLFWMRRSWHVATLDHDADAIASNVSRLSSGK